MYRCFCSSVLIVPVLARTNETAAPIRQPLFCLLFNSTARIVHRSSSQPRTNPRARYFATCRILCVSVGRKHDAEVEAPFEHRTLNVRGQILERGGESLRLRGVDTPFWGIPTTDNTHAACCQAWQQRGCPQQHNQTRRADSRPQAKASSDVTETNQTAAMREALRASSRIRMDPSAHGSRKESRFCPTKGRMPTMLALT